MSVAASAAVLTARPVVAALQVRGVDPAPILRRAGLSAEALGSIDHRLPCRTVRSLWQIAAEATQDPSFGIHVAEALPLGAFDVYEHILAAAETVSRGIARLARYAPLISGEATMKLVLEPGYARLVRRTPVIAPQYDEFSFTLLLVRSRQACGVAWTPQRMSFQHERANDDGELARVFGCRISLGAAETEMLIPAAVLELAQARADAMLSATLSRHLDAALRSLPPRGVLVGRVSSAIAGQIATELPTLSSTASTVRVPERTLQRHLKEEGVSHSALVDDVRRNLAFQYLGDPNLSVTDVAFMLHFGDSAAFYRAFKRWTAESPASYRRRFL